MRFSEKFLEGFILLILIVIKKRKQQDVVHSNQSLIAAPRFLSRSQVSKMLSDSERQNLILVKKSTLTAQLLPSNTSQY